MAERDITTLPVWVQQRISTAEDRVRQLEAAAADAVGDSNTYRQLLTSHPAIVTELGQSPRIIFRLDNGSEVVVRNQGEFLAITATGSTFESSLTVQPRQSNSLWVGVQGSMRSSERPIVG